MPGQTCPVAPDAITLTAAAAAGAGGGLWREGTKGTGGMALPESLTFDSQPPVGHSPRLHQPRILLAPALAGAWLDPSGAVVDLMGAGRDEELLVEFFARLPPCVD